MKGKLGKKGKHSDVDEDNPFPGIAFHSEEKPHPALNSPRSTPSTPTSAEKAERVEFDMSKPYDLRLVSGGLGMQGRRPKMEDRHVCQDRVEPQVGSKRLSYYAVFDGHGGDTAAEIASVSLLSHITGTAAYSAGAWDEAIREGLVLCDADILATPDPDQAPSVGDHPLSIAQVSSAEKRRRVGGTCVVTAMIVWHTHAISPQPHSLIISNLGDCEAILARRNKYGTVKAKILTKIHQARVPSEKKRIVELGGNVVRDRIFGDLAVSRSLGDASFKKPRMDEDYVSIEPYIQILRLDARMPFLLLACDGVWEKIGYQEAIDFVLAMLAEGKSPTETTQALIEMGLKRGSGDNCSAVIIQFKWTETPQVPSLPLTSSGSWVKARVQAPSFSSSPTEPEHGATTARPALSPRRGDAEWKRVSVLSRTNSAPIKKIPPPPPPRQRIPPLSPHQHQDSNTNTFHDYTGNVVTHTSPISKFPVILEEPTTIQIQPLDTDAPGHIEQKPDDTAPIDTKPMEEKIQDESSEHKEQPGISISSQDTPDSAVPIATDASEAVSVFVAQTEE